MKGNSQTRHNILVFRKGFRTQTGFYWTPGLFVAALTAIVLVVGGIGYTIYWVFFSASVELSAAKGKGDQVKQVNSGQNRSDWEAKFAQLKEAYDSEVKQIPGAKQAVVDWDKANGQKSDPFGTLAEQRQGLVTDLNGLRQQCHTNAQAFNTDSQRTSMGAQFKGKDMPDTLDDSACDS